MTNEKIDSLAALYESSPTAGQLITHVVREAFGEVTGDSLLKEYKDDLYHQASELMRSTPIPEEYDKPQTAEFLITLVDPEVPTYQPPAT